MKSNQELRDEAASLDQEITKLKKDCARAEKRVHEVKRDITKLRQVQVSECSMTVQRNDKEILHERPVTRDWLSVIANERVTRREIVEPLIVREPNSLTRAQELICYRTRRD